MLDIILEENYTTEELVDFDYREIIECSGDYVYTIGYVIDCAGNMIKVLESKLPN